VLAALFLAGLTVAVPGTVLSNGLSDALGACLVRLRTAYATPGGAAAAAAGLTSTGVVVLRVALAAGQVIGARREERRRQRMLVALRGRPAGTDTADHTEVVLHEPRPAAYCLPGRRRTVVVTSGAVDLLSRSQLSAVLGHEQAHLRARHHRLLVAAALAARSLPDLPFLRDLPRQVRRLLEMHADDLAATVHDPEVLATALVAMATAGSGTAAAPRAALGAADSDTAVRVRRLLLPPRSLTPRRRHAVRAAVAALGLIPVIAALTPAGIALTQPPVRTPPAVVVPTQV
jgi:bla regulator protein blaR1